MGGGDTEGGTRSPWMDIKLQRFGALEGAREVDLVVVGGGVTGATMALMLKRRGHKVALVEADHVGAGETGRSTAHLTSVLDCRFATLLSRFGRTGATMAVNSHAAAIDWIEQTVQELAIDCGFARVSGHLYAEKGDRHGAEIIAKEVEAAGTLGVSAVLRDSMPLPLPVEKVLAFPHQAQLDPMAYLRGLYRALAEPGAGVCEIYDATRVTAVEDGEPCQVHTEHGTIFCRAVAIAAHVPVVNRVLLHTKLEPMRTYVIARPIAAAANLGLFWDTASPYHYWRAARVADETLLLLGGADHDVGEPRRAREGFQALEQYADDRLGHMPVRYRWSGQVIEPVDGLAFIGRNALSNRVFVATGFSGNGITGGTLAAQIFAGEVEGNRHPAAEVFVATRLHPVASMRGFVRHNARAAKHLLFDRRHVSSIDEVACLAPNTGRVLNVDGEALAVYRESTGKLRAVSAVCTHLGCLVAWNGTERSWDCPCHGSRFAPDGTVVHGPAVEALPERDLEGTGNAGEVTVESETPVPEVIIGS